MDPCASMDVCTYIYCLARKALPLVRSLLLAFVEGTCNWMCNCWWQQQSCINFVNIWPLLFLYSPPRQLSLLPFRSICLFICFVFVLRWGQLLALLPLATKCNLARSRLFALPHVSSMGHGKRPKPGVNWISVTIIMKAVIKFNAISSCSSTLTCADWGKNKRKWQQNRNSKLEASLGWWS